MTQIEKPGSMLRLIQSNDLQQLAQHFSAVSAAESRDPLAAEIVIIQSVGTGQWLKLQTAEYLGISANLDCQLPAQFIWRLYQNILGLGNQKPVEASSLTFKLMQRLPTFKAPAVQQYLNAGPRLDLRCFQLATRISAAFEGYLLYRPEWIMAFEQGQNPISAAPNSAWQAELWRSLIATDPRLRTTHRAYLHQQLLKALQTQDHSTQLPKRISLFGLSSLAPLHLETFKHLANQCPVDLYVMNPSETYWGDITTEKSAQRTRLAALSKAPIAPSDDYAFLGNPILASLGRQGQEFHELLTSQADLISEEDFVPRHRTHRLGILQDDIYWARETEDSSVDGLLPEPQDSSLEFHSCHSPLREMEVLLDRIYRALADPSIQATDILVMAPDIQKYVAVIQAVFGDALPYGIADQNQYQNSDIFRSFSQLLNLPNSRLPASELITYLEVPTIARRFGIDDDGVTFIKAWIKETGIRWGRDGASKQQWSVPDETHFTWQFGLDQLLMGVLTDEAITDLDVLPYSLPLDHLMVLNAFLDFCQTVFETQTQLETARSPEQWANAVSILLERLFDPVDQERQDLMKLLDLNEEFLQLCLDAKFNRSVTLDFVTAWFEAQLNRPNPAMRFINGGITFSTLTPMRSIPFKMVCLVGMNESDFPRRDAVHPFDLMMNEPARIGDRSRRDDDRYLFLEALLSARDRLHISYCGRGIRDNELKPPSVLVNELLDYCEAVFGQQTVFDHPLQPFSQRYFQDPLIQSFENHWRIDPAPQSNDLPGLAEITSNEPIPTTLSVETLSRFLQNPARYFFESRLNINLTLRHEAIEDLEPFSLDPLTRFHITDLAIQAQATSTPRSQWISDILKQGLVPNFSLGKQALNDIALTAELLFTEIRSAYQLGRPSVTREHNVHGFTLQGRFDQLSKNHYLTYRAGDLTTRHLVHPWLSHLLLASSGTAIQTLTYGVRKGQLVSGHFEPMDQARAKDLLRPYLHAFTQGNSGLLVFPFETCRALLSHLDKGRTLPDALVQVDQTWRDPNAVTDAQDPYWSRLIESPLALSHFNIDQARTLLDPITAAWVQS
jgi:exodeoxyribonuclease V gamma subunit